MHDLKRNFDKVIPIANTTFAAKSGVTFEAKYFSLDLTV
jgi:hypothetical protein